MRPFEVSVPKIRPFRALRYRETAAPDLSLVVSPPYDIISPDQQRTLLARHPLNVVRLDLPETGPGDEPEERYRRAARTLAAWRSDGTLRKDPRAAFYVLEQTYQVPGSGDTRTQRGFFGRLRLESLEPGSSVRPHERTIASHREDRYRLLRATGVNTSPIVGLFEDAEGRSREVLERVAGRRPDADVTDDDGVVHRVWALTEVGDDAPDVATLAEAAASGPITIADGHHRYETALRYRDERRMSRSCEEDPAFDYVLTLFLEATSQALTVLPTHRVVLGRGDGDGPDLLAAATDLFEVEPADREQLAAFGAGEDAGGRGRFGLWTRVGGACLTARRDGFEREARGGSAARELDVAWLGVALERLCGIDPAAVSEGARVAYTKSASEALDWVDGGHQGAVAAFLLEPTPVASILAVAAAGDVMPQKSTYFYPKALTGLVINPHEW